MSIWGLVAMIFAMGLACGFWLGHRLAAWPRDGVGDADEYKAGGTD